MSENLLWKLCHKINATMWIAVQTCMYLTALKTRVNHDDNFICISYEFAFFRSLYCFFNLCQVTSWPSKWLGFPYGNPDAEFDVTSFFFWVKHASSNPLWTSSIDGTFSSKANRWRTKTILIRHYLIHWSFLVWFSCLWEW